MVTRMLSGEGRIRDVRHLNMRAPCRAEIFDPGGVVLGSPFEVGGADPVPARAIDLHTIRVRAAAQALGELRAAPGA